MKSEDFTTDAVKNFRKGEVVFYEGDEDKEVYIITSGKAEVVKNLLEEEIVLAKLETGDFFGEMAIIGGEARSATVRAVTNMETIIVSEDNFKAQLKKLPDWFGKMFETLIERIREMDKKVVSQYKYGLGISILQLLQLIAEQYGTHTENQLAVNREFLLDRIHLITGLSKGTIAKHLQGFLLAEILEVESETDKIIIPDKKRLDKFIDFFLVLSKSSKLEEVKKALPELSESEIDNFFELVKDLRQQHPDLLSMVSI